MLHVETLPGKKQGCLSCLQTKKTNVLSYAFWKRLKTYVKVSYTLLELSSISFWWRKAGGPRDHLFYTVWNP